jgi:hypothetical protein
MRKIILGLSSVAALMVAVPAAQSQVYVEGGRGGVAIGVDHDHDWRYRDHDWRWRQRHFRGAYGECRTIRERIETPSGRVIIKTRREC